MSGTPKYKIFDAHGTYQAACKEIEAAAALMGFYGDGSTIRVGHAKADTVWTEGAEDQPAADSFDHVAEVAADRRYTRGVAVLRDRGYNDDEIQTILGN